MKQNKILNLTFLMIGLILQTACSTNKSKELINPSIKGEVVINCGQYSTEYSIEEISTEFKTNTLITLVDDTINMEYTVAIKKRDMRAQQNEKS